MVGLGGGTRWDWEEEEGREGMGGLDGGHEGGMREKRGILW